MWFLENVRKTKEQAKEMRNNAVNQNQKKKKQLKSLKGNIVNPNQRYQSEISKLPDQKVKDGFI